MPSIALRSPKSLWSHNPIPRGCVLYLPLWSSGLRGGAFKSVDYYGHLATVTGATYGSQGRTFDGLDDIITLPDPASLQLTSDFTVEAWMKRGVADAFHVIAGKYDTGGNQRGWVFLFDQVSNKLEFTLSKDGTNVTQLQTTDTYTDTATWLHVVAAYNSIADGSSVMKIYVNGIERATTSTAVSPLHNSTDPIRIGCMQIADANTRFFKGMIGKIGLYNRALTPLEIQHNRLTTKWRYV